MIAYAIDSCDLGKILLARHADGICSVILADNETALWDELRRNFPQASQMWQRWPLCIRR